MIRFGQLAAATSLLMLLASARAFSQPKPLAQPDETRLERLAGRPADIASSAYLYRSDRRGEQNPPESWITLIQYAGLPYDRPVNTRSPVVKRVLCGLLWEEVRSVRRLELFWAGDAKRRPSPDDLTVTCFDATDRNAHTWWNPLTKRQAGKGEASADGRTLVYAIPTDTWGVVVSVRGKKDASDYSVPAIRAFVPYVWKPMDLEIEWAFDDAKAALDYTGRIEAYDGIISNVRPLARDAGTTMTGPRAWRSRGKGNSRRGVRMSLLYMGTSRWRRIWPYHAQPEDVARTILTVWTRSGSFSFLAADLENGPILAPEYGFFVRAGVRPREKTPPVRPAAPGVTPRAPLGPKMNDIFGRRNIRGWGVAASPWFAGNATNRPVTVKGITLPARGVAMHPGADRDVAVGWRSGIDGRFRLRANVADGQPGGGDGIVWSLVHEGKGGRKILLQGQINRGGSQAIGAKADAKKLADVAVRRGESLSLIVGRKGAHFCDTTVVQLVIAEIGGKARTWDLAGDVAGTVQAGNPHADSLGQADVWSFYTIQSSSSPARAPAVHAPPFAMGSEATTAGQFLKELAARGLGTVRQRVRTHREQTWEGAVGAMHPGKALPPHPKPPFEPAMQVEVPCKRLTAQWKLGAWHILRRSVKGAGGRWSFRDYPFGILASETYLILRALDLQGMHKEASDGLDQWLRLPMQPRATRAAGHHGNALPDRPLGLFSDGKGCLTHAVGPKGAGGHMDGVHCMGPGAIMFAMIEHFRLTGDVKWLEAAAPRMKANVEWILRQRRVLAGVLPGGRRLWSAGLQPAHVVTPDSYCMHMQFYETEAYYWLAVKRFAEILTRIDPVDARGLAAEAAAYRKDLLAAIERSIALTPVTPVRDGTYRSFIPFAPYVRGFAAGAWGRRRCGGHVGAIYWDTVQSADPLISPSGLLSPRDVRVRGHLDVLEDRLLLENSKVSAQRGFDPRKDWFSRASWQYQCGLERHANIHLAADDAPNFIRSMLNQYAVDIMPGEYTFREHTTGGPRDKSFEEAAWIERFRMMLVMEEGDSLWLARATPRAWLEQGRKIHVRNAPTHFGTVAYEIASDADNGKIAATVEMPSRNPPKTVFLRLRHPKALPIRSVTVSGKGWKDFDSGKEVIRLTGTRGRISVVARY